MANMYYKAAVFPGQPEARKTFLVLEEILKGHNRLNISVYSYLHLERKKWCVAIIGNTPSQSFDQRFTDILSSGESIHPEEREIVKLAQRRLQEMKPGKYIRKHHKRGKPL